MAFSKKTFRYHWLVFRKHDFRASITVFFVALPLCLGIALASGVPVYSGLVAGIIGGLVVSLVSGSQLSVSGPAAGLTAICAMVIQETGSAASLFVAVALAGLVQILLGLFRLGGFTHLIPSAVIKGMLTAIGILLISKQIPLLIGYDSPDFWTNELFNILTFDHAWQHIDSLYHKASFGVSMIALFLLILVIGWQRLFGEKRGTFLPVSFITVLFGVLLALVFEQFFPSVVLRPGQFVSIPDNVFEEMRLPDFTTFFAGAIIWKNALVIAFVATLESLLSIEAIDKLDPLNRITPQNRELLAQGTGNFLSGLLGGLPVTAVIVRSSANAEAGGRTRFSAFFHGIWLLLVVLFAVRWVNLIPYCALAVILIRTGYNLAKPQMILGVWRQGREQFVPFAVTVGAILFTDLLIGVGIGLAYSIYFLIKHTYEAGFSIREIREGHTAHFTLELAENVPFLNKKPIREALDRVPEYSILTISGRDSKYIDHDVLEIIQEFRTKAKSRHIELYLLGVPEVEQIESH